MMSELVHSVLNMFVENAASTRVLMGVIFLWLINISIISQ